MFFSTTATTVVPKRSEGRTAKNLPRANWILEDYCRGRRGKGLASPQANSSASVSISFSVLVCVSATLPTIESGGSILFAGSSFNRLIGEGRVPKRDNKATQRFRFRFRDLIDIQRGVGWRFMCARKNAKAASAIIISWRSLVDK